MNHKKFILWVFRFYPENLVMITVQNTMSTKRDIDSLSKMINRGQAVSKKKRKGNHRKDKRMRQ